MNVSLHEDKFKFSNKVLYTNIDGFLNKKDELLAMIDNEKPKIIAITEAKAKNQHDLNISEYAIPGYDMFVNDNHKRGIVVFVKEELNARECDIMNKCEFEECVWVQYKSKNNDQTVLIGCIYKSPNTTVENESRLIEMLKNDKIQSFDCVCILGDFNYPDINWKETNSNAGEKNRNFIDCLNDAYLTQVVDKPTRRRTGQRANILDLIIVNDEAFISDVDHFSPLGKSDHEVLLFSLYACDKNIESVNEKCYDIKSANFDKMREEIKVINWNILHDMNVEQCWNKIKESIQVTINKNIPKKKFLKVAKQKPKWMNKRTMREVKKKYTLYKKFLATNNRKDYQVYIKHRNVSNRKVREAKKEFEFKLSKECKDNPKCFWKYVKSKTKASTGISPLLTHEGKIAESNIDKAETLNTFFSSVFTKEDTNNMPNLDTASKSHGRVIDEVEITVEEVKKRLKSLNPAKAQGPDEIPAKVLKELSEELSIPLCILFKKSLSESTIPSDWKTATVIPIFKKGSKTNPGNYRPVSLTCIVCKILESFVRDAVVEHMTVHNLYAKCQHGFRKKRSCITQLLEVMEDFTKLLDDKDNVDVIYLDFRKAFDSVPHNRLITKLKAYGITNSIERWITNFLSDRTQRVKVGNSLSNSSRVISGIPQGSILGPVLFTVFINDLPDDLLSTCKIFADDTKLYNSSDRSTVLQCDIDKLLIWSNTWNLYFNAEKCKVLHIGNQIQKKNTK